MSVLAWALDSSGPVEELKVEVFCLKLFPYIITINLRFLELFSGKFSLKKAPWNILLSWYGNGFLCRSAELCVGSKFLDIGFTFASNLVEYVRSLFHVAFKEAK